MFYQQNSVVFFNVKQQGDHAFCLGDTHAAGGAHGDQAALRLRQLGEQLRCHAEDARAGAFEVRAGLRDLQILAENVPVLFFVAQRLYMGVNTRVGTLTPSFLRPQLLWSADTISVRP